LQGNRHQRSRKPFKFIASTLLIILTTSYFFSFFVTALWSVAKRWRYPDLLPESYTFSSWMRSVERLSDTLWTTLGLASISSIIAVLLCISALENEVRMRYKNNHTVKKNILLFWIYIPLLVPQVAFLFGFQVSLIYLDLDGTWLSVLWSHLIFVIPYVFLTLSDTYRNFDDRYIHIAKTLTKRRTKSYMSIKFIMLLRPILYSLAIGFSVSIAQYLPTLFIGAGHFSTVTTEAVAMTSGSNRRMMAVMTMWQQLLPFAVFSLAIIIPAIRFKSHRLMSHQ
jgi:putative thiamine transport system permease protein